MHHTQGMAKPIFKISIPRQQSQVLAARNKAGRREGEHKINVYNNDKLDKCGDLLNIIIIIIMIMIIII